MAIYCAVMCNRPRIYPNVILPGLISGVMWAIADIGWFVANDALSPIISFPIITSVSQVLLSWIINLHIFLIESYDAIHSLVCSVPAYLLFMTDLSNTFIIT